MRRFTTEARVGAFAVLIFLVGLWATTQTNDRPAGADSGYLYFADFPNVSGLVKDTSAEIAGIKVGYVERIELAGQKARVWIRVHKKARLPLDTVVLVKAKGALGDKTLAIIPGAVENEFIAEGGEIKVGPAPPDLDEIIRRVDNISRDIDRVSTSVSSVLGSEEGERRLSNILENMERFSNELASAGETNSQAITEIVENLRDLSAEVKELIAKVGDQVDGSFADLRKASERVDAALASVSSIAKKVDEGEGTLGKLVNDPGTAEKLDEAMEGVGDIVDSINRIKVYIDYHGEALAFRENLNPSDTVDFKNYLGLRIQPRPDYYYSLELVDDPRGRFSTKTTTFLETDTAGVQTTRSVEEQTVDDGFKFSAQFARRLRDATFRLGLKESSGGVGVDYYAAADRLRLSLDIFEFDRAGENPHLKFLAQYDFHKHVFVVGGADDVVSLQDQRRFFLGGGLTFNDDDLKFVFSSIPMP